MDAKRLKAIEDCSTLLSDLKFFDVSTNFDNIVLVSDTCKLISSLLLLLNNVDIPPEDIKKDIIDKYANMED